MRFLRPIACMVFLGFAFLSSESFTAGQGTKKTETDATGLIRSFKGHIGPVRAVDFSPDGKKLFSAADDKSIRVWDIVNEKKSYVFAEGMKHRSSLLTFALKPTPAKFFFTDGAFHDGRITKWDSTARRTVFAAGDFLYGAKCIRVSPDGKYVACGTANTKLMVWDAVSGVRLREFDTNQGHVHAVAWTPDSKRVVASTDADGSLRMWEIASGKLVWRYKTTEKKPEVMCALITPDGKKLITGNQDHIIRIIDLGDKDEPIVLKGHTSNVFSIDISLDGTILVSGSEDRTVRVWDLARQEEIHQFKHDGEVYCVVFSPDGKRVASASRDETVRLWGLGK